MRTSTPKQERRKSASRIIVHLAPDIVVLIHQITRLRTHDVNRNDVMKWAFDLLFSDRDFSTAIGRASTYYVTQADKLVVFAPSSDNDYKLLERATQTASAIFKEITKELACSLLMFGIDPREDTYEFDRFNECNNEIIIHPPRERKCIKTV
jgi:hypothetical protein